MKEQNQNERGLINLISVLGQQQHFFDSRLTYHASRSAVGVAMGAAGYPLANNWGYNNYSSYLGYNSGVVGSAYQTPLASYGSPVIDPLLSTGTAPVSSDTTSPSGNVESLSRECD